MNINVQLKLSSSEYVCLCFRHAVILAQQGVNINMEVDDFDSEYYMGTTSCVVCKEEREAEEIKMMREYKDAVSKREIRIQRK